LINQKIDAWFNRFAYFCRRFIQSPTTKSPAKISQIALGSLRITQKQSFINRKQAMDIENFSEEVYTIIKKLIARTERINTWQGEIPAIEIDLALEDIRRLYDCYLTISTMPGAKGTEPEAMAIQEVNNDLEISEGEYLEPAPTGDHAEEITQGKMAKESNTLPKEKTSSELYSSPPREEEADQMGAEQPATAEHKGTTILHVPELPTEVTQEEREKQSTGKILADTLRKDDLRSINDLIAVKKSDISISTRMQHNPISNLKRAIGINEKFIFVYELFGGNTQLYSETIERLNSMEGRNEAIALLETLRREYHWDIENMAFQKLVDMVSRRYS
jgi:hypothetical protein